jgi:hypothetical protein
MEATCSFETSVDFQWSIWRYISEDKTFLYPSMGEFEALQKRQFLSTFFGRPIQKNTLFGET